MDENLAGQRRTIQSIERIETTLEEMHEESREFRVDLRE